MELLNLRALKFYLEVTVEVFLQASRQQVISRPRAGRARAGPRRSPPLVAPAATQKLWMRHLPPLELVGGEAASRVCIITGPTSGIGWETAFALAQRGAHGKCCLQEGGWQEQPAALCPARLLPVRPPCALHCLCCPSKQAPCRRLVQGFTRVQQKLSWTPPCLCSGAGLPQFEQRPGAEGVDRSGGESQRPGAPVGRGGYPTSASFSLRLAARRATLAAR